MSVKNDTTPIWNKSRGRRLTSPLLFAVDGVSDTSAICNRGRLSENL